jgi:hypothetical protein
MIIVASQRRNAEELARHLLNAIDNDHVDVHRIQGFMAESVSGAFEESRQFSQSTRCKQHLFSVSFNPPKHEKVSTEQFEHAIQQCAEKMGLQNQPHVIVFHEKAGLRHAHAVWCRIDTENMKAVHLPYYKNKMAELSKSLYLKHGWQLPKGHLEQAKRNPLNFSLYEWQQAKRLDVDPRVMKQALKQCWENSDNRQSFENALSEYGYVLARGTRRGYVATDWRGEVISLSRWLGVKKRDLKAHLGHEQDLPDIEKAKAAMDKKLIEQMQGFDRQIRQSHAPRQKALLASKDKMVKFHQKQRQELLEAQRERNVNEQEIRNARHAKGILGLWQRVTGQYKNIRDRNHIDAYMAYLRDRKERDTLIFQHLNERQYLNLQLDSSRSNMLKEINDTQKFVFSSLTSENSKEINQQLSKLQQAELTFNI